ncbi:transmembrane protein 268-like [Stegostoma tigrinum]|uniref:transmembrane protein 268-like n=1 Tax=Stegostoma tigrinum TaxID=3053191 RepID=UPI00202B92A7|nr:transmembrane protein 268-like [Stegostoma tigrinum]
MSYCSLESSIVEALCLKQEWTCRETGGGGVQRAAVDGNEERQVSSICRSMAYGIEHNSHTVSTRHLPAERDGWLKVPQNGQVILALSSNNCCWSQDFDMDACVRRLEGLGFQISLGIYRKQITNLLKDSAIRRYMFFNSRAFRLVLVTIFYLIAWGNIYSTFHQLSMNGLLFYLLVSLGATVITTIIILLLDRYAKKVNINTDMRLAAVNEILMNHNLLVGVTDTMEGFRSILQLLFVYFNLEKCKEVLTTLLEQKEMDIFFQSKLQKQLSHLYLTNGHPVNLHEEFQSKVIGTSEEQPLLSNSGKVHKSKFTFSEMTSFVMKGTAEEIARCLLITYSGVYVRLLVTRQLPPSPVIHQAAQIPAPCLCQFIQYTVLNLKNI